MRQVSPHWRTAVELNGRVYVAEMGYDPENRPRVNAIFTEYNQGPTRSRRAVHNIRLPIRQDGPTWSRVVAAIESKVDK